jgi:iron complex outermembrane receptor protein
MRASGGVSVALIALLAALTDPAAAQQPDSVIAIPGLLVSAPRAVTTTGGSSAITVSLDSLPLPPAPTMERVLREVPSLHVRTNSRGEAEISVRGSESRQVAVLVDGVPLTLAWDARADASVIPATPGLELTLVRGLSSMLHGPNAVGGVVEVSVGRTLAQPAPTAQVALGMDHVGGVSTSASVAVPKRSSGGEWLVQAGGSFTDSPGVPLPDDVGEPVPTDDGLRLNTDAENRNGFLGVRYRADGGAWASLSGFGFLAERGIAAELGVTNARFWRYPHVSRAVAAVSAGTGTKRSPFGGEGDVELSLGYDAGRSEIDIYTSRAYDQTNGFEDGEDRTLSVRALADQTLGARGDLRGAFTLADVRHDEFLPDAQARYRQRLWSAGLENVWRVVDDPSGALEVLRLSLGGAWDVAETPESGGREPRQQALDQWGARVGLSATVNDGNTLLHAGASRRGRFPSLRELYSGAANRFQPNPALRPEKLVALEAGVTTRVGRGDLQLVGFRHRLSDAVVRITLPDLRFMRVNRNLLESQGVEVLFTQAFGPLRLSGDVTAQAVDLTDTDAEQTRRPENLPELFATLRADARLPLGLEASASANYVGEQFCIDPGTGADATLAAGTQLDASVGRSWTLRPTGSSWFSRLETRVAAANVGDAARFDQCGLPQPGRLLQLQLRVF